MRQVALLRELSLGLLDALPAVIHRNLHPLEDDVEEQDSNSRIETEKAFARLLNVSPSSVRCWE